MNSQIEEAVVRYQQLGFQVTPLEGKIPKFKTWQDRSEDDPDVAKALERTTNIGLVLGERSGNLIDIDCDCIEAIRIAPLVLPATPARFRRGTRPDSHYLYLADEASRTTQFKGSDGAMLVELRSTGSQTMAPPSIHPNGEDVHWSEFESPARVRMEDLKPKVVTIAAASEIARHWKVGTRHPCALALSGALLRTGWAIADVKFFVECVCKGAGDEELDDRLRTVDSSFERLKQDQPATGWPELDNLLSEACGKRVRKWLGINAVAKPKARATGYAHDENGMYRLLTTEGGTVRQRITNFSARIRKEISTDDGQTKRREFLIEAQLHGKKFEFEIPAERFDGMEWVTTHLGAKAAIEPRCIEAARAATKLFSEDCESVDRYGSTGWRKIDGEWFYLHSEGAIGADGSRRDIKCVLPGCLMPVALELDESKLADDFASVRRLMQLEPRGVVLPSLAASFRTSVGACGLNLINEGRTNTMKTALAGITQSFYGRGFDNTKLPASWQATGNGLESIAHAAKDMVLVIDDYCPNLTQHDSQREETKLDRLCRSNTEGTGRARGTRDGGLVEGRAPRCTILATSESLPSKRSLRARAVILSQGDGVKNLELLSQCQADAANGCYERIMASFLSYIAGRRDENLTRVAVRERELRAQLFAGGLARLPDMEAKLIAGMELFAEFIVEKKLATEAEAQQCVQELRIELATWRIAQSALVAQADPVELVLRGARTALASRVAHIASRDGSRPEDAKLCASLGWRLGGAEFSQFESWVPGGTCIGTVEGDNLVLFHAPAIDAARRTLGVESSALPDSRRFLDELNRQGWITRREEKRGERTVRQSIDNVRYVGVQISLERFLAHGDEPAQEVA